jgi:hypothetical protein
MANGYTIFATYLLESTEGYSTAIHCNYIQAIPMQTDTPDLMEVNMSFPNINDFKFLNNNIANGTGFTIHKIYVLLQSAIGITDSGITIVANPANWYKFDLTDQIKTDGTPLTATELTSRSFRIPLYGLYYSSTGFTSYNLTYLDYPASGTSKLCFGDEIYFLGNVTTEIHADVYVTDLSVTLALDEFNLSTNKTWNPNRPVNPDKSVSISEIGIYDDSNPKNLVAIGKLNSPIDKDSTIARTILFALDF